ncbi:MAG: glycosyltransferase [Acidobacteriota bacterium]
MRLLYLCYLDVREPLVQNQVLPYLRQLAADGNEVHLLTFDSRDAKARTGEEVAAEKNRFSQDGINWTFLTYHKRPSAPATLYDILAGAAKTVRLVRRYKIDVLHARAHIALAMALLAQRWTRSRLVFDLRGLVAEEYADAGIWKENSRPFRAIKKIERAGLVRADEIIVLSERFRDWLVEQRLATAGKIEVIPCCVDLKRFDDDSLTPPEGFEVIYAGSVVGLYLLEEMGRFFLALKQQRPDASFRVLTLTPRERVAEVFRRVGIDAADFHVTAVAPLEVAGLLQRARLGITFRKPAFSQIAASPTKIAEYLAAGLPVVSNSGTGDVDKILETEGVGITVDTFDDRTLAAAATQALALADKPGINRQCRMAARTHFDLINVGGRGYRSVYQRIADRKNRSNDG